ncbi:UNVERIFIED_CONTAM: Serine/arginine-rich splicing factor RS41 [Sesamum radiatum]|uniref:Serine/arginine-rich splicing factor RS41 n=1 Tax=Sesamum radiatum TaxID=300843 RepID=A0AAW2VHW4_SESRA
MLQGIWFPSYHTVKSNWRLKNLVSAGTFRMMRPIFCGNLEFDARQSDVERLFRRYGRVDRVDMKSGFAFVYMEDERDAEDAIRKLDRIEFGRKGRRLRVEWTKQERGGKKPDSSRRSSANSRPSKTLFVINFDPINTRTRDLERHFEQYGRILNVRIRRNFAFIQYEMQEDATRALEATHMSKFMDRVISVEYAIRDDDDKRNGYSPDRRGRDASPDRNYGRGRSPSPYRRDRGSPDYGHGSVPNSRSERRDSPDYGRGESPANDRYHSIYLTSECIIYNTAVHLHVKDPDLEKEETHGKHWWHRLPSSDNSPPCAIISA